MLSRVIWDPVRQGSRAIAAVIASQESFNVLVPNTSDP